MLAAAAVAAGIVPPCSGYRQAVNKQWSVAHQLWTYVCPRQQAGSLPKLFNVNSCSKH